MLTVIPAFTSKVSLEMPARVQFCIYYNYSFAMTTLIINAGVMRPRHQASGAKNGAWRPGGWRHCLCVPRICVIHDACGMAAKSQLECSTLTLH